MRLLFLITLSLIGSIGLGQNKATQLYFHLDKMTVKDKSLKDSTFYIQEKEEAYTQFQLNGYVGIRLIDSLEKSNGLHYYYEADKRISKIKLVNSNETRTRKNTSFTSNYSSALSTLNKKLKYLENHGYPFAKLNITDFIEEDNNLTINYKIDSGDFYLIDKVHIKSEDKIHENTVLNILGVKPGDVYNESKVIAIGDILSASDIYKSIQPTQVLFKKGKAEVFVYIKKRKSSSADGYIGFQQDQVTDKLVLNGFINLDLKNSLNRAELIDFHWKSNPDKTQNLRGNVEYPYLFNSSFGLGTSGNIQKQDTTFVRGDFTFEGSYYHPNFKISVFDQLENSFLLGEYSPTGFRSYKKNTIGVKLNLRPKMPEGLSFYRPGINLMGGIFNYRSDTIDDNKQKIQNRKYSLGYEHSIKFFRYFELYNNLSYQGLTSAIAISRNEMIYFGGLRTVRGFYELELAGKEIWILNNELIYRPVELLSFKLIHDYSNFFNESHHYTHSFGLGFGLQSQNILLEIILANGKIDDDPFTLSNSKVHIGVKSNF